MSREDMEQQLYVYHREQSTEVLGPGKRFVIWVQGCELNCPGCLVPDTHSIDRGGEWMTVRQLVAEIKHVPDLRGVTFSGGEPFLQAKALGVLAREIKETTTLDVISFSGYTLDQLLKRGKKQPDIFALLSQLDMLIDGRYEETLNEGQWMRGSANQTIHHFTDAYARYEEQMNGLKNRSVEVKVRENGELFIVGVPPQDFQTDWNQVRQNLYSKK